LEDDMMDRRRFLARGAGGLAGILASRRAPALAQTTRLHLLHRVDFIPQGEAELKRQLADYGRQMKIEVVLETINENDLQTRITAAIQSGAGGRTSSRCSTTGRTSMRAASST
jgi:multiple sugar transport system substrate-binding protein